MDRFWLSVLPGAAAAIGGLIMLLSTRRSTASFGGMLALAGGLWLIAGPTVSMLWNDGTTAAGTAIGDNGTRVLEWLGFFYGVGGLITMFAAYALGFLAALPVVDEAVRPDEREPVRTAPATAATTSAAATPAAATDRDERPATRPAPTATAPTRRRGFLRRGRRRDDQTVERR
jgi:hypothetical protein